MGFKSWTHVAGDVQHCQVNAFFVFGYSNFKNVSSQIFFFHHVRTSPYKWCALSMIANIHNFETNVRLSIIAKLSSDNLHFCIGWGFFRANFESYEKPFDKLCSTSVLRSDGCFWKSRWDSGKTNMKVFQTLLLHFTLLAFPSLQVGATTFILLNTE